MLTITDLGCKRHNRRQFTLGGHEAEIMIDILYNLPNDGDFHTFICEYGHTHRISFNLQLANLVGPKVIGKPYATRYFPLGHRE
jgi:hypothetical protein